MSAGIGVGVGFAQHDEDENASLALAIADRGYVIRNGVIVLAEAAHALLHDPAVQDAYLGRREAVTIP